MNLPTKAFLVLLILFNITGCSKKKTIIPEGVLDQKKMAEVLTEVHLLESKISRMYLGTDSSKVVYSHYEKMLFTELGITQEEYQRSLNFYVEEVEDFHKIYEVVVDSLLARQKGDQL